MKCTKKIVALACLLASITVLASSIATVNGVSIDKGEADKVITNLVKNGQQDTIALREQVRLLLIDRELVRQECLRKKMDKQPIFKERLETAKFEILQNMFLEEALKAHPIDETEIRKKYDELKKKMMEGQDFELSQIIVKTEKEAKDIIVSLKKQKSQKFAELAKFRSTDTKARQSGGSLGVLNSKLLEVKFPNLFKILATLNKGAVIEEPIQSDSGWHIFRIDDIRRAQIPTYEDAKPQIVRSLQAQVVEKIISALRSNAAVK